LVISVDTSVAHLAGAAGLKTWLLLAYVPDWRWKTVGEKTEWYESVSCFRQTKSGSWKEVIDAVKEKLKGMFEREEASIESAKALMDKGEYLLAIEVLNRSLLRKGDDAETLNLLAANYSALGKFDEAEKYLKRLLAKENKNVNAIINLGIVLFNKKDFENAFMQFEQAKNLSPENSAINYNYAVALETSGNYEKAIEEYRCALELTPENHVVKNNLGMSLLRMKNYREGWKYFESRFFTGELKRQEMHGKRWDGEIAKEKTLYVYSDQGYGDAIQFSRFLKEAKKRVGKIIFEIQSELLPLYYGFKEIDKLVATKPDFSTNEKYDLQIPLLSLPYALNATNEMPEICFPYLTVEKQKAEKWKKYFTGKKNIGFAWRGNHVFARNQIRSTSLDYFLQLSRETDVKFYSLQKNITEKEKNILRKNGIENIADKFIDFTDTAAAISNLDLVITTDTVIPHLAGVLDKPTFLLLAYVSDWRWGTDETVSSWYSSLTLIRQTNLGDWASVFEKVKEELKT
jgi:Flp pilus assembly protein TadD/ADP-heptose:LPS heptosyltransferase